MDDESYSSLFQEVYDQIYYNFKPQAIVMQCGADSISGDRLGCFNLSVAGHGACLQFAKKYSVPLLVMGGGGYTLRNVARAWAYETSILVEKPIASEMPQHDYLEYYSPEYKIHTPTSNMENQNTKKDLDRIKSLLIENIKRISPNPGVDPVCIPDCSTGSAKQKVEDKAPDVRIPGIDVI
jgi:histone deacetylase 1/2